MARLLRRGKVFTKAPQHRSVPTGEKPGRRRGMMLVLAGLVAAAISGCASIPAEAPQLSAEVGNRLQEFERAHVAMLHALMDERRADVDAFLQNEWLPTLSANLMANPAIRDVFNIAADRSLSDADRITAMNILGTEVQAAINAKRRELMAPVDALERELERRLRDEYQVARYMNNHVTSFLLSAAEVAELRDRYLAEIGVDQSAVRVAVDETNVVIEQLKNRRVGVDERTDAFVRELQRIIEVLRDPGPHD